MHKKLSFRKNPLLLTEIGFHLGTSLAILVLMSFLVLQYCCSFKDSMFNQALYFSTPLNKHSQKQAKILKKRDIIKIERPFSFKQ